MPYYNLFDLNQPSVQPVRVVTKAQVYSLVAEQEKLLVDNLVVILPYFFAYIK